MPLKQKGAYLTKDLRQPHQNVSSLIVPETVKENFLNGTPIREFLELTVEKGKSGKFEKPQDDPKFDFMISTKVPRSSRLVTCPVKIVGYEYDLKEGYSKLPALREIKQDSFDQEMNVMHITKKKIMLDQIHDAEVAKDINIITTTDQNLVIEKNFEIHLGPETEQNRVARYHISNNVEDPFLIKIMPELESKPGSGERLFNLEAGYHINICSKADDFSWEKLNLEYYIKEVEKLINLKEISIEEIGK